MNQTTAISSIRAWCNNAPRPLVFVPTMGALHEGHISLIRHARKLAGSEGRVVVSIFVNPAQFGPKEDLSNYPRPLEADVSLCKQEQVDFLFCPSVEEMYPFAASIKMDEIELSQTLCGRSRPHHFAGVITVVSKLFNIITPSHALFGEKDWQQLAIIRRLVRDLNFPIEIISHPTVREEDGLAMSSRNVYLSNDERKEASLLYQTLLATASLAKAGEKKVPTLLNFLRTSLNTIPNSYIDYVEIVDAYNLQPLTTLTPRSEARLLVALKIGNTRLIDNISLIT